MATSSCPYCHNDFEFCNELIPIAHREFLFWVLPQKSICPSCLAKKTIKEFNQYCQNIFYLDGEKNVRVNWQNFELQIKYRLILERFFLYLGITCIDSNISSLCCGSIYYQFAYHTNPHFHDHISRHLETYFKKEEDARNWYRIVKKANGYRGPIRLLQITILEPT